MALTDPRAVQLIDEVVQGNKRLLLGVVRPLGGTEPPAGAVMHPPAEELHEVLVGISDAGKLADFVAANLDLALPAKAELLAIDEVNRRLERLAELLGQELQVLEVGSQIQEKVRTRLDQNQREYVLREQ